MSTPNPRTIRIDSVAARSVRNKVNCRCAGRYLERPGFDGEPRTMTATRPHKTTLWNSCTPADAESDEVHGRSEGEHAPRTNTPTAPRWRKGCRGPPSGLPGCGSCTRPHHRIVGRRAGHTHHPVQLLPALSIGSVVLTELYSSLQSRRVGLYSHHLLLIGTPHQVQ